MVQGKAGKKVQGKAGKKAKNKREATSSNVATDQGPATPAITARTFNSTNLSGDYALCLAKPQDRLLLQRLVSASDAGASADVQLSSITVNGQPTSVAKLCELVTSTHIEPAPSPTGKPDGAKASTQSVATTPDKTVALTVRAVPGCGKAETVVMGADLFGALQRQLQQPELSESWKVCHSFFLWLMAC